MQFLNFKHSIRKLEQGFWSNCHPKLDQNDIVLDRWGRVIGLVMGVTPFNILDPPRLERHRNVITSCNKCNNFET